MLDKSINKTVNIYNNSSEIIFDSVSTIWGIFEWNIRFFSNIHPSSVSWLTTASWHFNVFWTNSDTYSIDYYWNTMASMWTVNFNWTVTNTRLSWEPTTVGSHASVYNILAITFKTYYKNNVNKTIKIYENKQIWQKLKAYLFWRLPNWTWWDWN